MNTQVFKYLSESFVCSQIPVFLLMQPILHNKKTACLAKALKEIILLMPDSAHKNASLKICNMLFASIIVEDNAIDKIMEDKRKQR